MGYLLLFIALFAGVLRAINACFIVTSRTMYQMAFKEALPS
jgi:amino acid transporter